MSLLIFVKGQISLVLVTRFEANIIVSILRIPIKTAFPDYTGKSNYDESISFIKERFKEQRKQGPVFVQSIFQFFRPI